MGVELGGEVFCDFRIRGNHVGLLSLRRGYGVENFNSGGVADEFPGFGADGGLAGPTEEEFRVG